MVVLPRSRRYRSASRPSAGGARRRDDLAARVTIYPRHLRHPHVFGETDASTLFGFAYAQAGGQLLADRGQLHQVARSTRRGGGRDGLVGDRRCPHARGPASCAGRVCPYAATDAQVARSVRRGLNAYLADHPDVHPRLLYPLRTVVSARLHPIQLLPEWLLLELGTRARRPRGGAGGFISPVEGFRFERLGDRADQERDRARHAVHQSASAVFGSGQVYEGPYPGATRDGTSPGTPASGFPSRTSDTMSRWAG